jgi:hypothetical protein
MFLAIACMMPVVAMAKGTPTSPCPTGNGANNFDDQPDPTVTGCNSVITYNGSVVVTTPGATGYNVIGAQLVGVVNNSPNPIFSLTITGTNVFALVAGPGHGICTFTFAGDGYCSPSQIAGTIPQSYYGPTSTFVINNANSGTVYFSPPIPASGGTTFFSLEGIPGVITSPGVTVSITPLGVPLLSMGVLTLLAALLLAAGLWHHRAVA